MANVFDNVMYQGDLKDRLETAFKDLDDILMDHSGPFATNCVIGSRWRQVNDVDEFTKDGIKILLHLIVSEDTAARFAARMSRFIGVAVDARCHDGTTTSMLLFCRLALIALEKLDTPFLAADRYLWAGKIKAALNECLAFLETIKITEGDMFDLCQEHGIDTTITEVRSAIAYHMAMISSKGDHGLSQKVATVIRSSPRKIYGMFKDSPLSVETDEPYILKRQESDIAFGCNIGNMNDFNYKTNTQYMTENAVIFATGNEIVNDSMESAFLTAFISDRPTYKANLPEFTDKGGWENFHEGKRNLILITPLLNDPNLITEINLFNNKNPDIRISWVNLHVGGTMKSALNKTIHYIAGVPVFKDVMMFDAENGIDATQCLIGLQGTNVKAHFIGAVMALYNLYEKDGDVYHPLYRNPEKFPPYTAFAKEVEELIEFANSNVTNPALDKQELTFLTALYRSLTTQEIWDIELGGSIHDQYANRTVYEDAVGAALSAVNEGVVMGGYAHLAKFAARSQSLGGTLDGIYEQFYTAFESIVLDSLRIPPDGAEELVTLQDSITSRFDYIVADKDEYIRSEGNDTYVTAQSLKQKEALEIFLKQSPEQTILFQAYAGYQEQFKRFRDILPRLATTTHFVDMRRSSDSNDVM